MPFYIFFFFKQKTAYEMRISDWSSDVCSSDLRVTPEGRFANWAANEMPERAILRLEGPLGAFYLREDSQRPIVMVAGGTGIAPIHAMLDELLTSGAQRAEIGRASGRERGC